MSRFSIIFFCYNLDGYFWHTESNCDLIYRDIKGANLLVDAFGVVKLADFGMAKHVSYELFKSLVLWNKRQFLIVEK